MATNRSKSVTSHHADVPQLLGGTAIKPVERHGWERVRYFLHNPETGAFCSRTPKSWFLIFLFYVIYYSCLAGFWYGMLQIFFLTLNDETPKWMKEESIIGVNPGMGVRPRQADSRIDSSMYLFNGNWNGEKTNDIEQDSDAGFAARMSDFLERTLVEGQSGAVNCSDEDLNKPRDKSQPPCIFDSSSFGACAKFPYGYSKDSGLNPCVIVKLNKIFGLVPQPFEANDDLPAAIPEAVRNLIKNPGEPRRVYIECHGENAADEEAEFHRETVERTLEELGAGEVPRVVVLNQVDIADPARVEAMMAAHDAVKVSARTGEGTAALLARVEEEVFRARAAVTRAQAGEGELHPPDVVAFDGVI